MLFLSSFKVSACHPSCSRAQIVNHFTLSMEKINGSEYFLILLTNTDTDISITDVPAVRL